MAEFLFREFIVSGERASRRVLAGVRIGFRGLVLLIVIGVSQAQAQTTGSAASPERGTLRERKVALVIGNSAYETSALKNPVNDARAVAKVLRELDFDVLLRENVTSEGFTEALRTFGSRLKPGSVALFYFAGHGMQVGGRNYLIPVGASIENEDEVPYRAIDANQVLDKMSRANSSLNLVILDACRNNPFTRSFRAQINGLAHMEAPSGTLIAFATSPGSVAADGDGTNSTYTKHLLANIAVPGVPVEIALKRVREGVSRETLGKQIPWESSSIMGDFYFRSGEAGTKVAIAETPETRFSAEKAFWESIQDKGGTEEYLAYLRQYPNGRFAALAKTRLAAEQAKAPSSASANTSPQFGATDPFELAYWDSIKGSTSAADFRAYLEQFPKGKFAVLARNRIGTMEPQVAAVRSAAIGTSSALRDLPKIGDTWTYDILDRGRKTDTLTVSIAGVSPEGRITEKLARAKFPNFSTKRTFEPEFNPRTYQEIDTPGQMYLPEFSPYISPDASMIGKNWDDLSPALTSGVSDTRRETWSMRMEIVGSEKIRVPAGEFMTIKVEGVTEPHSYNGVGSGSLKLTYWYAPQVKRTIRFVREVRVSYHPLRQEEIYELANYKLKD
jgi:hypothetical protein